MITAPGMDALLSDTDNNIEDILKKLTISKKVHSTDQIFIVGHHDCLANPVEDEIHNQQIINSVVRIKELYPTCEVTGLWVDQEFWVSVISKIN